MKTENTKAQMRKGVLEYCILLVLEDRPLYVNDIIEKLFKSKMIDVEGTLYPMLIRLKNEGYLVSATKESLQGPPQKFYEITEIGKLFLIKLENSWNELVDGIFHINDPK